MTSQKKHWVLADLPLSEYFAPLQVQVELVDLAEFLSNDTNSHRSGEKIEGLLTYGHPKVDEGLLKLLPRLKIISNHGVGVDHIDLRAARDRGIPVAHTPGAVDGATADLAITLMLTTARRIIACHEFAKTSDYRRADFSDQQILSLRGRDVFGATLGIVGLGRIGKQIAKRARGFDMRILYYKRHRDALAENELGVEYSELGPLLRSCDFVIISVPLDASTYHMIGRAELKQMKSTAILVNVARGGVVDTEALIEAIQEGWIGGAGLDVTEPEPLPADHPLLSMANVMVLPHIGSFTEQTRRTMAELTSRQLLAGLNGSPIQFDATA